MNISITGIHMEVGESFTSHINSKVTDVIRKYFEHPLDVQVIISKETYRITSEIIAHVGKGITVHVEAETTDPHQAFDVSLNKLEMSLKRYHSRLKSHHMKYQQQEKQALQYVISSEYRNLNAASPEEGLNPTIIAEMPTEIPHLTVSEAVMRMDLANSPIYMFYNGAHGGLNVVYLRKDGNIGWVDPEGAKMVKRT